MQKIVIALLIIGISGCMETNPMLLPSAQLTALKTANSDLACRFHKEISNKKGSHKADWYFWRKQNRTETRDALSNQGEIWEHQTHGKYFYTRLFYNEHIALEFTPGDLAAANTSPSLMQLNSLVDPALFGKQLILINRETFKGNVLEHYYGSVDEISTELDWLPKWQLPAKIKKILPDGSLILTLSECGNNSDKFKVKSISKAELESFRRLDYTDLGDMEEDPVVKHIQQLMGGDTKHHSH